MNVNYFIVPPRLKRFRRALKHRPFKLLDVGCAHDSVLITKKWYPKCAYYGLDYTDAFLNADERAVMVDFYKVDLENDNLSTVPDAFFDVIVMAHVVEHLRDGHRALALLAKKLAPNGHIYVEFPSVRSLALPRASKHGMHFSDDPTHVRVYTVAEIANTLLAAKMRIMKGGRRRDWGRVALAPLTLPLQLWSLLTTGRLHGIGLWDVMSFADFVYACKVQPDGSALPATPSDAMAAH
jgi:SAM-dependent methyltransferase